MCRGAPADALPPGAAVVRSPVRLRVDGAEREGGRQAVAAGAEPDGSQWQLQRRRRSAQLQIFSADRGDRGRRHSGRRGKQWFIRGKAHASHALTAGCATYSNLMPHGQAGVGGAAQQRPEAPLEQGAEHSRGDARKDQPGAEAALEEQPGNAGRHRHQALGEPQPAAVLLQSL